MGTETLKGRANLLRESLHQCRSVNEKMISTLDSFDRRVSFLHEAWKPLQERTNTIPKAKDRIDVTLELVEDMCEQFDLMHQANAKLLKGPSDDLKGYVDAMDQLRNVLGFFSARRSFMNNEEVLNIKNLLSTANQQLEDDFQSHLLSNSKSLEPGLVSLPLTNSLEGIVWNPHTVNNPETLPLLHGLALQLFHAGRHQQCLNIYREVRSSVLEESLKKFGVRRLGKDDVQKMEWNDLEAKTGHWIEIMHIAVKLLFAGERQVCDQIFEGIDTPKDQCFCDVTTNSVEMLLSFGAAIVEIQKSPEKLFVLLDMYEAMQELQSKIEMIFQGKACDMKRQSMLNLTKRIAYIAYEILDDFVQLVEKDRWKDLDSFSPGAVHPLTRYVVSYIKFLFDYRSTLEHILKEYETGEVTGAYLQAITERIWQVLQGTLERKSKQYDDPALGSLFLMNNFQQMVKSVRTSELKGFLGDEWILRRRKIVQLNANMYKRTAWKKILECFDTRALSTEVRSNTQLLQSRVKERFKLFTMQFEELLQRQGLWEVADDELRDSLRLSICEVLLPAYRSFILRFGRIIDKRKGPKKYIKYTSEELEEKVSEIFTGESSQ